MIFISIQHNWATLCTVALEHKKGIQSLVTYSFTYIVEKRSFILIHSFIHSFVQFSHSFICFAFYFLSILCSSGCRIFNLFHLIRNAWHNLELGCWRMQNNIQKKNLANDHVCRVFGKMQHPKLHKTIHTNYINDYNNNNIDDNNNKNTNKKKIYRNQQHIFSSTGKKYHPLTQPKLKTKRNSNRYTSCYSWVWN